MKILVYADEGVSSFTLKETLKTFGTLSTHVKTINHEKLLSEDWEIQTDLLIFPGGRDIPYDRKLKGKGIEKIRDFVKQGGSFLGICAGAYFASKEVVFEKGTPLEVHEKRDLCFFPGKAIGTLYPSKHFPYQSHQGAQASLIVCKESHMHLYYNGGCTFDKAEKFPSVTVIAQYGDAENQPAIIHCVVGQGSVLLSGVHFEVCAQSLTKEKCDPEIIVKLNASEIKRQNLISTLLKYL